MHRDRTVIVVAAIAHIHMHLADLISDQVLNLLHLLGQRVAVIGVSSKTLCTDEPSAMTAHRDTDLVAELILLACFAFCDAFHFRLMNRVDLVLVMPLLRMDQM